MSPGSTDMKPRVLLRGLLLIVSLAAVGYLIRVTGIDSLIDQTWIDSSVRGHGLRGELVFLVVGTLATAIGLPRQVVSFFAGHAFGFAIGTATALACSVAGCIVAFAYARLFGRRMIAARFPTRIRRVDDFLRDNPMTMTLLVRLLPVGSNLATNLVAGVSSVPAVAFFAGSALGYLPQTLVFALAGSGVAINPVLRIGLAAALFVVSAVLGVHLFRRYRRGKRLEEDIERELANDADDTEEPITRSETAADR